MQRILLSILATVLTCSLVAPAWSQDDGDTFLNSRYERTEYRAMGGVDLTVDPRNPAVAALNTRGQVTIFNVDVYGTLSEGLRAYSNLYDLWDTEWNFDLETRQDFEELAAQIESTSEDVVGDKLTLVGRVLIDVGHTAISTEKFTLQFGLYSRALGGARFRSPPQIEVAGTGSSTRIEFGERTRVARTGSIIDAGVFVAPGGFVSASDKFHIGLGARVRSFYRFLLPTHEVTVDATVNGTGDVDFPRDIEEEHGAGLGVDLYSTLHFGEDTNTGFRLSIVGEDVLTWVGSPEIESEFITPRLGIGASFITANERGVFGVDLERVATLEPTFQLGGSYRVGPPPANMTLSLGALINERDIEGTQLDPAFTGGFNVHLGILNLGAMVEYQLGRKAFNAGLSFGFGWKSKDKDEEDGEDSTTDEGPGTNPPPAGASDSEPRALVPAPRATAASASL